MIILDEPTVGLDPLQILEIRDLVRQLGRAHTVLFSSHILSEVQAICDQILILSKGKLVAFDAPENLERQLLSGGEITLTCDGSREGAAAILAGVEHITSLTLEEGAGYATAHLKTDLEDIHVLSRALFQAFSQAGVPLLELSLKKASLEQVFLELTESGGGGKAESGPDAGPDRKEVEA